MLAARSVRTAALVMLVTLLTGLLVSCGGSAGEPGGARSGSLSIDSARWSAKPEPGAVVSGEWGVGISTPPSCSLLEGRKGPPSGWYDPKGQIRLDGGRFHQEFVKDPDSPAALDPQKDYYVRCRVSGDTGNVLETEAPVRGKMPVGKAPAS